MFHKICDSAFHLSQEFSLFFHLQTPTVQIHCHMLQLVLRQNDLTVEMLQATVHKCLL